MYPEHEMAHDMESALRHFYWLRADENGLPEYRRAILPNRWYIRDEETLKFWMVAAALPYHLKEALWVKDDSTWPRGDTTYHVVVACMPHLTGDLRKIVKRNGWKQPHLEN